MLIHLALEGDRPGLDAALVSGADALWFCGAAAAQAARLHAASTAARRLALYAVVPPGSFDQDLDTLIPAAPDRIVVTPRAAADLQQAGVKLAVREAEQGIDDGATRIIAKISGAGAVANLTRLAAATPRLAALCFAAQDFAASLGIADAGAAPVALARNLTLLAAKAAGIEALLVVGSEPLAQAAKAASRDGFDGIVTSDPAAAAAIRAMP